MKTNFGIFGLVVTLASGLALGALGSGCSSSNNNPKPDGGAGTTGTAGRGGTTGSAGTGGSTGSGGSGGGTGGSATGTGGATGGATGGGGTTGAAGSGGTTGAAGSGGAGGATGGTTGGGGSGGATGTGGTTGTGGGGGSQPGCFSGTPADRQAGSKDFLNRCTGNGCFPFNNTQRLPNWNGGPLTPL